MHATKLDYAKDATEMIFNIINITYYKEDLKEVVYSTYQLNYEESKLILRLLKQYKDLFNMSLVYWDTEPVFIEKNQTPRQ